MLNIDTDNQEAIKVFLLDLIFACPIGGNPDFCICKKIREMPIPDRIKWVNDMTHKERVEIYLAHKECLIERETTGI